MGFELLQVDVTQGDDIRVEVLQKPDALFALGPAFVIFGAGQLALGPRVADDHL